MKTLRDKTLFITGASRGIGAAIAVRAARDGANVAVVAKTDKPHPKLPGTVYTAVDQINRAGGQGLPCICDIRYEDQVQRAVERTVAAFGGIDIVVNNASAIALTGTLQTTMKRFDLMHDVNARGTFLCSKLCLPILLNAENGHILTIAPPLSLDSRWFENHLAYTMAKYGMSMCVLGMSEEFRDQGIGVNGLWPKTAIATAAIANLLGGAEAMRRCRKPEIMADAAYAIVTQESRECSGHFFIDEQVLRDHGVRDFQRYAVDPNATLMDDFFVD